MTAGGPSQLLLPTFADGFLNDHAGLIMSDPNIAIVELVANSWDAGADQMEITWPTAEGGTLTVEDNGVGMTEDEFIGRWRTLGYNRVQAQGSEIVFPKGNRQSSRKAFGRNGKGRHSMFCFGPEYDVITWKDGHAVTFRVIRSYGESPFGISIVNHMSKRGHGTIVSGELIQNYLSGSIVRDLIGSKFVADPSFRISVNGEPVEFIDLRHLVDTTDVTVPGIGTVQVHRFDSQKTGRTSRQHGVAWWVYRRLVGEPSWRGFADDAYLDASTTEAKRYTFVVEADVLESDVTPDWREFKQTDRFERVHDLVRQHIHDQIQKLMQDVHKSRKVAALEANRQNLKDLAPLSRYRLGAFLDEIQAKSPTISQRDLAATVEVLSKLEQSQNRYKLLEQLAKLDPSDFDGLSRLLDEWTVTDARIVLDELGQRLHLIASLENLVESPSADELHDIQPIFERGLWIFGPEYESISFMANRTLARVLSDLLGDKVVALTTPKRRPDFVVLADSTIGIYTSDEHDERGEVQGVFKVLILELKRGGFEVGVPEQRQAHDYANEIRKSGKVGNATEIVAYVLGARVAAETLEPVMQGNTTICARTYSVVLRQAHARTFNLLQRVKSFGQEKELIDLDVERVVNSPEQPPLFVDERA
jgi:hypothetical protein